MFGDGIAFLEKECLEMPQHSVVYVDPPYVTNGHKLYRYHFDKSQHVAVGGRNRHPPGALVDALRQSRPYPRAIRRRTDPVCRNLPDRSNPRVL